MISHEHRCIFIHIPKTAGSSIENKLGLFDEVRAGVQDHRTLREFEPFRLGHLASVLDRSDPYLLKRIRNGLRGDDAPSREQYAGYFKFSFVRNTWARVFSWYRNVMTNPAHMQQRGIEEQMSLHDFLSRFPDEWGTRSQLWWIRDSTGRIGLDFVGRFERLAEDFAVVGERLGLQDASLPKLVVGEGKTYTEHYDPASIDLVASRYREEILEFGFEYGQ